MRDGHGAPPWSRVGGPLVLAGVGWLCSAQMMFADDGVRALVSNCRDSPGTAVYVLPLAWAGLVLGVVAVCWGGWQLVAAGRRKELRIGLRQVALCVVLPVAVVAVPLQYALAQTAVRDSGYRHSSCFGLGQLGQGADGVGSSTEWTAKPPLVTGAKGASAMQVPTTGW
ncbi:hypothetical protein ABTY61_31980 [Kitasatospora sp. NPDC096128]|uniref:hypothetical protein n=1 Tax=Kitasatospora sp. NPDC096128 TaxID=3155547 RepID=UPI00332661B2